MSDTDRDIQTARNVLARFAHRPDHEKDAILREWFGRKATPAFIAKAKA
jgi:broad specificity phosphatase PhoE